MGLPLITVEQLALALEEAELNFRVAESALRAAEAGAVERYHEARDRLLGLHALLEDSAQEKEDTVTGPRSAAGSLLEKKSPAR